MHRCGLTMTRSPADSIDSADDKLDVELQQRFSKQRPQLIPTDCPIASHSKWSLLCKIYMEYQQYMSTEPKVRINIRQS